MALPCRAAHGLATDPCSGTLWALLAITDATELALVTLDPTTGIATLIGNTGDFFVDLAFDPGGILYAATADAFDPDRPDGSLFTLNKSDATPTCVAAFERSPREDQAIAFHDNDGHLYRIAGQTEVIFESLPLMPSSTCTMPMAAPPAPCASPVATTNIALTFHGRGHGPPLEAVTDLALEADGNLVAVYGNLQAVIRIDTR